MDAEITLHYPSPLFAKSVMTGLSPDNKLASRRMQISVSVNGRALRVLVRNCDRIETLQGTVQDIFRCVRAAEASLVNLAFRR